ncbi:MAG: hypothetical protein LUC60_04155, partial [Lachnospiraceae bacterium]|nr:hypothetical protein [Lachnospiraceae bacterium]
MYETQQDQENADFPAGFGDDERIISAWFDCVGERQRGGDSVESELEETDSDTVEELLEEADNDTVTAVTEETDSDGASVILEGTDSNTVTTLSEEDNSNTAITNIEAASASIAEKSASEGKQDVSEPEIASEESSENAIMLTTSSNGGNGEEETNGAESAEPVTTGTETATAFAVYSETDNSLRFYKRTDCPEVEDTYNGLVATAVFTTDIESVTYEWEHYYDIPWYNYRGSIEKVVVEDEIKAVNLRYWFYGATNLRSVDVKKMDTSAVK